MSEAILALAHHMWEVSTTWKLRDQLESFKGRKLGFIQPHPYPTSSHLLVRIGFEHFSCKATQQKTLKIREWQVVFSVVPNQDLWLLLL